jgi:starch synthase
VLNTVSENYAEEMRETDDDSITDWLGHRLMTRNIRLAGITNGFNHEDFDTTQPEALGLPAAFNPAARDLAGKKICRHNLLKSLEKQRSKSLRYFGSLIDDPGKPLYTLIGRLTPQKGVDILLPALEALLQSEKEFQVLILGSGAKDAEKGLVALTQKKENEGRICLIIGFNQILANQIYAAGDFFLIPSRYEPCGLTDYIAQLAGNLPIVHHVGGLLKVKDGVTGFAFKDYSPEALIAAILRATKVFRESPEQILDMQEAAAKLVREKYSWDRVVKHYFKLYEKAMTMVG